MTNFKTYIKNELNTEQRKAVTKKSGSLLVVAGAGSGKTRVITARIMNLISTHDVAPSEIVALTFTNKAAKEMKERIVKFLGNDVPLPFIGTFHSYCLQLLKRHSELLDEPFIGIMDADDQHKLLSELIKKFALGKRITAKKLSYHISMYKNSFALDTAATQYFEPWIMDVFRAYEHEKKLSKCLDFDDLLLNTLNVLRKHQGFRTQMQINVRHVLVDEYQDTNVTQHELLKLLALCPKKNFALDSLCAVGDEDQSIYSWRGATIENILNFKRDFKKTTTVTIEQNYRSAKPILHVANQVIKHNEERNPKNLWSDKEGKNRITLLSCLTDQHESQALAQFAHVRTAAKRPGALAILYRAHHQSRKIEEALIRQSIPYRIIGGTRFYDRMEIKDTLAWLRMLVNPFDRLSFTRIINTPPRGLGDKFQELFKTTWQEQPFLDVIHIAQHLLDQKIVAGKKKEALVHVLTSLKKLQRHEKAQDVLEELKKTIDPPYRLWLRAHYPQDEAQERCKNIDELYDALHHFIGQGFKTVKAILDEIALLQDASLQNTDESQAVQLMTVHAAKGLEFDTVAICGLEEGTFPSMMSLDDPARVEEERRLLYVAITRAQEYLLLTHARYRATFGSLDPYNPSRFLDELHYRYVQTMDNVSGTDRDARKFFERWLQVKPTVSADNPFAQFIKPATITSTKELFKKRSDKKISTSGFAVNRPVKHAKFGVGLIKKIEDKTDKTVATVSFKSGEKKIDTKFLTMV